VTERNKERERQIYSYRETDRETRKQRYKEIHGDRET